MAAPLKQPTLNLPGPGNMPLTGGENLGRHLIQAFAPGEVTPEEAHQIGLELAKEILGGKYEFVLTTHIDRGHIHNHVIWNNPN